MLDAADRVRESVARLVDEAKEGNTEEKERKRSIEGDAVSAWAVAVNLLGSGAERLEADRKRELVSKIITLTCLIIDNWILKTAAADFEKLKERLSNDKEIVDTLAKSNSDRDIAEARGTISGLVDVLEYNLLSYPFRFLISTLCEEARDNVLAESITNTVISGAFENLIKSIWLSDINTAEGAKQLHELIKEIPKAKFLRLTLASHLLTRVYWKHWNREDRLKLLGLAGECLKALGLNFNATELTMLLAREAKEEEALKKEGKKS